MPSYPFLDSVEHEIKFMSQIGCRPARQTKIQSHRLVERAINLIAISSPLLPHYNSQSTVFVNEPATKQRIAETSMGAFVSGCGILF